jgi:hypothetical protein
METKKFQKRVENFVCEHCGAQVRGDGYTNHCPQCLWSKHVDVNPGDRAASCRGLMEPLALEGSLAHFKILHRCVVCGFERRNGVEPQDDRDTLIALSTRAAEGT